MPVAYVREVPRGPKVKGPIANLSNHAALSHGKKSLATCFFLDNSYVNEALAVLAGTTNSREIAFLYKNNI